MNLADIFASALEAALNAYLRLDAEIATDLEIISGKAIELKITDFNIIVFIIPEQKSVRILTHYEEKPDSCIAGSMAGLVHLGRTRKQLPGDEVNITGDIEVGKTLQDVLSRVDVDWEELLAERIGDVTAHQVGNIARTVAAWTLRARQSMAMNLSEYLQEESLILPTHVEVEAFMDDVDSFRNDIDRLEARMNRIDAFLRQAGIAP